jgi:hypothetical protein
MASFIGTSKEFRRYIGPRLRNLVQQFTKQHKAIVSACEHCGSKENLESAHVHGRDRNEIIDIILRDFTYNDIATVDIERFEDRFKDEHQPLEKSILILCRDCHRKYDLSISSTDQVEETDVTEEPNPNSSKTKDQDCVLPISLEPSDPDIFKSELLLSKQAEIEAIYADGRVEIKTWNASKFKLASNLFGNLRSRPEFRSGNWQEKGIVKVHVRIKK